MSEGFSSKDEYNQNGCFQYKWHEANAFKILLSGTYKRSMTLRQLHLAAEEAAPKLDKKQLSVVIHHLKESLALRQNYSLRFRHAPLQHRRGHDFWSGLIQHIIDFANPHAPDEERTEEFEDVDMTAGKATFLRFLEDIESCVAQAEDLWRRVAKGKAHISTASILTKTCLCTVTSMVNAEMLLNPSWFTKDRLAAHVSADGFPYWTELRACVYNIDDIFMKVVPPIFLSGTPFSNAPLLTQMLVKVKELHHSMIISEVPFIAAVAASLAARCSNLGLSTENLCSPVHMQIISTDVILARHAETYKDTTNTIHDILRDMKSIKTWAATCHDAISFGQIMSWLRIRHVLCVRLFVHDSSLLQLFAYICERTRINGKPLHPVLEGLFNDRRITGFLFLDGRPKNLGDCVRGIERWSDPKGMLDNLELTQDIFGARYKPTVAQQIFEGRGGATHAIIEQLNGRSLEEYLDWELEPPDPMRLEAILISTIRNDMGNDSIKLEFDAVETSFSHTEDETSFSHTEDETSFSHTKDETGFSHTEDETSFSHTKDETGFSHTEDETSFSHTENEHTVPARES
ncbi:hypothetical protein KJE20_03614 [Pyrenophora tritici-repentis]|nr:hypothetical protein KJE20_03614 [Pyrenophora tritici-repentis]